ncbi:hypothetical protein B0A50_01662 [Salinomyces thailandicus]|uniref:Uncharacterized protein n=1 Tax=Salinomyces thailandicus TaxID=706561 RepID=A0A4U0UBF6_9PEZI|nr:hypothetical protein B0A50_01662 [Salinomyces thailandica]
MLEHVHHRVPVTALSFHRRDHVILAGHGNLLRGYDIDTGQILTNLKVFDDQAVHGILVTPDEDVLLVWGGRLVRKLNGHSISTYRPSNVYEARDWILDAALSPEDDCIAFVDAHNALTICNIRDLSAEDDGSTKPLATAVPSSNCILYSAHVTWLSGSQCLIASGTAFGDVMLWSASISRIADGSFTAVAQTHYTFSAHEGSVFGVQLSSKQQARRLGDGCDCLLASCSDDRQVKVWDVSDRFTNSHSLPQIQRDTGFGSKPEAEEHAPPCLAAAMGHVSRIWKIRFCDHDAQKGVEIMSFGEDASNILWSVKPDSEPGNQPFALKQVGVQNAHAGKQIWSVAAAEDGCFATGGADGAIAIHHAPNLPAEPSEIDRKMLEPGDNIRYYAFFNQGAMLATTDSGSVWTLQLGAAGTSSAREVLPALPALRGYSVVASISRLAFLAGSAGIVYMYNANTNKLTSVADCGKKVTGLFVSSHEKSHSVRLVDLLITTVGQSDPCYMRFVRDAISTAEYVSPREDHQPSLPIPEGFSITSFTTMEHAQPCIHLTLVGARNGSIAICNTSSDGHDGLIKLLPNVHGKEAVTALLWRSHGNKPTTLSGYLHSLGKDGTHAVHNIRRHDQKWEIELIHQLGLPFGPNIEGLTILPNDHLLIWGFRGKAFIVYDADAEQETMTVACGGAHRNFAFQPSVEGGTFVWTKASKIYQHMQTRRPYTLITPGDHGREIKAVSVSSTEDMQIFATGAEDTNIKLSTFDEKDGFRCVQTLRRHNTGIQHLCWSSACRYLFSSGGFEEFYVWRVTTGVPVLGGVGVVCESVHPNSGKSDLRILGFDISETRQKGVFDIVLAYSDSTLKQWSYDIGTWSLVSTIDYLTACLTEVFHTSGHVITTATDGHLALWDTEASASSLTWRTRHRTHQNAILGVAFRELHDRSSLVFTAGDDNAIGITRIEQCGAVRALLIPRAHTAAVTAVAVVPSDTDRNTLLLLSASIDQRVKLWTVSIDVTEPGVDGVHVKLQRNVATSVADVSSLALCRLAGDEGVGCVVCRVGMEIWRIGGGIRDTYLSRVSDEVIRE